MITSSPHEVVGTLSSEIDRVEADLDCRSVPAISYTFSVEKGVVKPDRFTELVGAPDVDLDELVDAGQRILGSMGKKALYGLLLSDDTCAPVTSWHPDQHDVLTAASVLPLKVLGGEVNSFSKNDILHAVDQGTAQEIFDGELEAGAAVYLRPNTLHASPSHRDIVRAIADQTRANSRRTVFKLYGMRSD